MSVWVLTGDCGDGVTRAALVDSVSMTAFGPVFSGDDECDGAEEAEAFLDWLRGPHGTDPRRLDASALADAVVRFRKARAA